MTAHDWLHVILGAFGLVGWALYVIAQGSADELVVDVVRLELDNANLSAENRLLRRDVAHLYGHPSTLARVVDLDERRGLR